MGSLPAGVRAGGEGGGRSRVRGPSRGAEGTGEAFVASGGRRGVKEGGGGGGMGRACVCGGERRGIKGESSDREEWAGGQWNGWVKEKREVEGGDEAGVRRERWEDEGKTSGEGRARQGKEGSRVRRDRWKGNEWTGALRKGKSGEGARRSQGTAGKG